MLCVWNGNCRSSVALAQPYRFTGIHTYGLIAFARQLAMKLIVDN